MTKSLDLDIIVLSIDDHIPDTVGAVITSADELDSIDFDKDRIVTFKKSPQWTVNSALRILDGRIEIGKIVIGIDPGKYPGIAVLEGDKVIAVYHVSAREVPGLVRQIISEYPGSQNIVRIGHGARLVRTRLINSIMDMGILVEVVDETGTSPRMGRGIHGQEVSDIIAAINIARLKGTTVGKQEVEPSVGEIKRIQEYSREHSNGKATIPRHLARKVAKGELTIDEAIEEHALT